MRFSLEIAFYCRSRRCLPFRRRRLSLVIARDRDLAGVLEHGARARGHRETWEVSTSSP
jgi:hypothetical protein